MATLDDLLVPVEENPRKLQGTDFEFTDADTLRGPNNELYRLQGVDAYETSHVRDDGTIKVGEVGGQELTDEVVQLANQLGFDNIVHLDEEAAFGRGTVDLHDKAGRSFRRHLAQAGLAPVLGGYDNDRLQESADYGAFLRTSKDYKPTSWDEAKQAVDKAMAEQVSYGQRFDQVANFGRTDIDAKTGRSMNPLSDAWDVGLIGVQESMWGVIDMFGEKTGYKPLENIGEGGVNRARANIADRGSLILDYKQITDPDEAGTWFDKSIEYITNNAAMSLPYMGISIAGAVAAPFTGGLSLSAPASVYAGQTWNQMEGDNKSASIAIAAGVAQAALDRLGLSFLAGTGKVGKDLLKDATEELVKRGMTKKEAQDMVMAASRKEIAGFAGDVAQVAANQLKAKNLFKNTATRMGGAAGGEAATEALQELTGYAGAVIGSDKMWDWDEVNSNLTNALIAGGTLGGAFTVPGTLYDAGAWADIKVRQAPADAQRLSTAGKYAEEEKARFGRISSNEENAAVARAAGVAAGPNAFPSLNERADLHKQSKKERTFGEAMFDTIAATPALWRGATRSIFTPDILARSRAARMMADMFGGGLQKTFSGATYENQKHHNVTIYKNMVSDPDQVFAAFNNGRKANRKQKKEISDRIYNKLRAAINEDGQFDPNLIPDTDPEKQALVALEGQLKRLADKMYDDQKNYNPELGYLKNYLLRYKAFNKKAIVDQKPRFISLLMDNFNMPESEAKAIADAITESEDINDMADALTAAGAAGNPGSHKRRSLDLAEKADFADFMETDMFANVSSAAKSAARYTAYEQFVGKDHVVLNQLLKQMQDEGLSADEVNRIASQMKDYLDAESGNYKRPKTEAGKRLQQVQRNFMMVTTLAGLPLATISSMVELALSMRALTMDQIFRKEGGLESIGKEFADTIWTGMKEVSYVGAREPYSPATKGKEMLKNMGFYDWEVGAATTTGVSETNPWQKQIYESFFKWVGLQGWTNYTRAVRASIAGDFIVDKLNVILEGGDVKTNEVQEAEEQLRNLGINVDQMLEAYRGDGMFDPASADVLEQNFREGTFNFINDAVALPQSANRPLLYQDPRFALFTQFQGFIATFTANHIPKLWGEYVARGTPAMKYNAFAIMTTMIMLGFVSQYLKDMIKYGKPLEFGPDDHPFLNTSEYAQRGIRASGLLGTGERVLDQFFPLYDQRSDNAGEWLYHGITGESPALGYADRAFKGAGKALTGDISGATKEAVRFIPFAGPFNFLRDKAAYSVQGWNFNGE